MAVRRAAAPRRPRRRALPSASSRAPLIEDLLEELMQPPAEHVHWMFATGFLLLALFLLAEAIVGRGGLAAAHVADVPLAVVRVPDGRPHVARDDVLHELDDPHGRARGVGPGDDARRAPRSSGSCEGKLHSALWRLAMPFAFLVSGDRVPAARAEPVALPALVVPAPLARLDDRPVGAVFPLARASGRGGRSRTPASRSCSSSSRSRCIADRDLAPVFGHLSPLAGEPHR